MTVRWIGQSGYIVKTQSTEIIIDPYLSDAVYRIANRKRCVKAPIEPWEIRSDAVICTHDHPDHLDSDAIAEMNKKLTFITTSEGKCRLEKMGFDAVCFVSVGESVSVGDIKITAVFAKHTVEAFGLIAEAEDIKLYFSGDTLFDKRLFEISKFAPDITFICINGKLGNMNADEAVVAAEKIGARVNIPNHYGMFESNTEDPRAFTDKIHNGFVMEFDKEYNVWDILNKEKIC